MINKRNLISLGSLLSLAGFILSGPVGFLLVQAIQPQPAWTSAANFVENYDSLQNIPYWCGFILVVGMLILAAAHYLNADEAGPFDKLHVLLALTWTTIFAVLIFFNYICQISFIHHMARHYKSEYDSVISTLTMANPSSLSWSIEMWGYAILGVATWHMSVFYRNRNPLIYVLLIANGIVSVLSAVLFVIDERWLLTTKFSRLFFLEPADDCVAYPGIQTFKILKMKVDNLEMTGKLAAAFYAAFAISHMVSDVLYVFEI